MEYILLIGTFESIFLLLLLLGKKNKSLPDYLLGVIFVLYAISIGSVYLEIQNIRNNFAYSAIISSSWVFLFLHGPALWFYVKSLSDREFSVLKLLAAGKSVSEIAESLFLSVTTVSTYRSRIMAKMSMKNNADLTLYSIEHKLI